MLSLGQSCRWKNVSARDIGRNFTSDFIIYVEHEQEIFLRHIDKHKTCLLSTFLGENSYVFVSNWYYISPLGLINSYLWGQKKNMPGIFDARGTLNIGRV